MAKRLVKTTANAFFVDRDTHPQTIGVIQTRARAFGYEIIIGDPAKDLKPETVFAALLSYPGSSGEIRDYRGVIDKLHGAGAMAIMATDLLALALLTPPGELGADIAVGSAQRFGVPMGYGGPHAAFFATREEFKRAMPGRIIGVSIDAEGHRALRMAMQTREQHIRREKATSNICTNQGLMALAASVYLSLLGQNGLRQVAELCYHKAHYAAEKINRLHGFSLAAQGDFFHEFVVKCPKKVEEINDHLLEHSILGGYDLGKDYPNLENNMLIAVTEMNRKEEIDTFCEVLEEVCHD